MDNSRFGGEGTQPSVCEGPHWPQKRIKSEQVIAEWLVLISKPSADIARSPCYTAGACDSLALIEHPYRAICHAYSGVFRCIVCVAGRRLKQALHSHQVAWSLRWGRNLMVFPHEQMAWKGMKWNSETFILLYSLQPFLFSLCNFMLFATDSHPWKLASPHRL